MKKIVLFGALLLTYAGIAQKTTIEQDSEQLKSVRPIAPAQADNNTNRATPFWTEDFGNGIPATWSVIDSSGICPWVYSTDGSWGNFSTGGTTAAAPGISSTTSANGFILSDIDSANHFTYGQPSGSNYQYLSTYIGTDGIDCSGRSSVILKFEQSYRFNNGVSMNVQVSNDNMTWTTYNVSGGLANNANSPDPQNVSLNITTVAANQSTVYIRFGWSARVYFWMIDDISLSEADPFDIAADDSWWGMNTFDYQYYKTPLSQIAPITFQTKLTNNTGSSLAGSTATTTVSGTSGTVFTGSSSPISLAASATDTVSSTTSWTPIATGSYTMTTVASSTSGTDGNPANNTYIDSLQITPSTFGLDNLTSASQSTGSISNFSANTGQPFKIGNLYQVTNDDIVECIHVGIANNAQNNGKEIFAEVYAYDDVAGDFVLRGSTFYHTITTNEVGTIISLEMAVLGEVFAGEEILVVAGHSGGLPAGTDDVSFMYGQSVPNQMVYGYDGIGDLYFLSNPRAIVVRPDFDCGLSVDEASKTIDASVFPNPAQDQLTVRLASEITSGTITMTDLNGRVVLTQEVKSVSSDIQLNVANIANGMYTVQIQSNKGVKAIQVAVSH